MSGRGSVWAGRVVFGVVMLMTFLAAEADDAVGQITPSTGIALGSSTTTVGIVIDLASNESAVGSYGANLEWDPTELQLVGVSGGDPPFDDPVINDDGAATGLLRLADAEPTAPVGQLRVLTVTFKSLLAIPATTEVHLEFTSLFEAETFVDRRPDVVVRDGVICVPDFDYELQLGGGAATVMSWNALEGAATYDVIRGSLNNLGDTGATVDLGTLTCIENDSSDTTGPVDSELPSPGQAFYYIVRFEDIGVATYGFFLGCNQERIAGPGDCLGPNREE